MTDRHDTTPGMDPVPRAAGTPGYSPAPAGAPTGPGPAHAGGPVYDTDPVSGSPYAPGSTAATTPDYSPRPVAVRRPDVPAGLLLLLAAAAAAISLLLRWLSDDDRTGLDLVRRGIDDLVDSVGTVIGNGFWQPLTVIAAGAVLLVLGLLVLLPAKRHRFLGLLGLLVSGAAAAAVLVPLAQSGWDPGTFDLGFWFAVAVPVLGLLGAVKALLTGRTYRQDPADS